MADESSERQLGFADLDLNDTPPEQVEITKISNETKNVGVIPIDSGANLFTGAYGDPKTHMGKVPPGATGRITKTKTQKGVTSAYIEFESPPELLNHSYWVERRRKGPGFV